MRNVPKCVHAKMIHVSSCRRSAARHVFCLAVAGPSPSAVAMQLLVFCSCNVPLEWFPGVQPGLPTVCLSVAGGVDRRLGRIPVSFDFVSVSLRRIKWEVINHPRS